MRAERCDPPQITACMHAAHSWVHVGGRSLLCDMRALRDQTTPTATHINAQFAPLHWRLCVYPRCDDGDCCCCIIRRTVSLRSMSTCQGGLRV